MCKPVLLFLVVSMHSASIAETHIVEATAMQFSPEVLYVNAGDTIHWEYVSGFPHTVTTGSNCLWDGYFHASLSSFNPIVIWDVPMDAPEEIPYFCLPHCNEGMTAFIYVSHPCIGDITDDALVNVLDLLAVIESWGTDDPLADVNSDGVVNVLDLLSIIGQWGPCE